MADRPVRPAATSADAGLARRLIETAASATLAVIDAEGRPYAALTAPACDADGAPLLLASDMSAHGRALRQDGRLTLLFADTLDAEDPLKTARLTVQGRVAPAGPEARESFLARRPEAALYIDFGDMQLYRVTVEAAHLVAGFGRAVTIPPDALAASGPVISDKSVT